MSEKSQEIIERMAPKHLTPDPPPDPRQLKKEIEKDSETATEKEEEKPEIDPRMEREYTFDFRWVSPTKKVYKGTFTNKILNLRDRHTAGIMRVQLAGGVSPQSMDWTTREINFIVSHLTMSLIKCPDWAEDLFALDELSLLQAIYKEVASHEEMFLGLGESKEEGAEKR